MRGVYARYLMNGSNYSSVPIASCATSSFRRMGNI